MPENTNNWGDWSNHVLIELKRLNESYENIEKKIEDHCIQQARADGELKAQVTQLMEDVGKLKSKNGNGRSNDTKLATEV